MAIERTGFIDHRQLVTLEMFEFKLKSCLNCAKDHTHTDLGEEMPTTNCNC